MSKYYIISGEASGDLHGSNLIKHLKLQDPPAEFRCWGGDKMKAQGAVIVKHYRDLAFMGFAEVLMNIRTILNNISFCKEDILQYKPDVLILIDYPGFNLRIAEWAKENGLKVIYYISPQIWAWKQSRVYKIKKVVDKMLVILPFEEAFYQKFDYKVHFVGHPLLDAIEEFKQKASTHFIEKNKLSSKPIIAVLPGSRKQEVAGMLNEMLSVANHFSAYEFVIAAAPSLEKEFYEQFKTKGFKIVYGQTYDLLNVAHAALVTSGTATLETALFRIPQVVCYKGNKISYLIAKQLVKIKYISLVNLIMDAPVVTELIQDEMNADNIKKELIRIVEENPDRTKMLDEYHILAQKLGGTGASAKAAGEIISFLKQNK